MRHAQKSLGTILTLILLATLGCSSPLAGDSGGGGDDGGGGGGTGGGGTPGTNAVVFTPVGDAIAPDLIDIAFLPGQNGESLAIGLGGTVYYLRNDFSPLSDTFSIVVDSDTEQGLLNVVADPDYASNHFVYFYFTVPGSSPDINRVDRFTVSVDVGMGNFALMDRQTIINFNKSQSSAPGSNHNGGGLLFDLDGNLLIGVGDGGGSASSDTGEEISQNLSLSLGKIHRIIPNRNPGQGNYSDTPGNLSGSIYAPGVRNPFTAVLDEDGDIFFGDVGEGLFEEINCVYFAGENYGWPHCEGPCSNPLFRGPTHGYRHDDDTFVNEDPLSAPDAIKFHDGVDHGDANKSIMVLAYYQGDQYNGLFTNKLIYSDFYLSWVRALELNAIDQVVDDGHIGHQHGMTSLQENPADGFLYGASLFGADRILRMDLAP